MDLQRAWPRIKPRQWQADALHAIQSALDRDTRGVVQAVMGSGKSYVIAEVCALYEGRILVSAPTRALVRQLGATIAQRTQENIGLFFTDQKTSDRITVVCHASLEAFSEHMDEEGFDIDLWVSDEAHRTENEQVANPISLIDPRQRIGFTATPYLSEKSKSITMFDHLIYRYLAGDALSDGVVVPWKIEHHNPMFGQTVDASCREWIKDLVQHRGGCRVLCDALSILDAERWAEELRAFNIAAQPVHSGLNPSQCAERINLLKEGDLDVVVHVQMLREGVDMPWLRALVLRAPCSSRVAFAQHVGRALRSHPDKEHALIYDPQDLFNTHKLTYEAALGDVAPDEDTLNVTQELRQLRSSSSKPKRVRLAEEVDALHRIIRQLYVAADACGVMPAERFIPYRNTSRASKSQIRLILSKGQRLGRLSVEMPPVVRDAFREVWFKVPCLERSAASDFIELLNMLIAEGGWPKHGSTLIR